jgi:hypothetical protein
VTTNAKVVESNTSANLTLLNQPSSQLIFVKIHKDNWLKMPLEGKMRQKLFKQHFTPPARVGLPYSSVLFTKATALSVHIS